MIDLTINPQELFRGLFALFLTLVIFFLIAWLVVFKRSHSLHHTLTDNGFYVFEMENNVRKIILHTFILLLLSSGVGGSGLSDNYFFRKIQAKTIKNKELLIVQEKSNTYPKNRVVMVLKNPKFQFPSFKLTRNLLENKKVPKKISERDVRNYYQISTTDQDILLSKLQLSSLKKHYSKIIKQVFEIELDQKLHMLTIKSASYITSVHQILSFMMTLDTELEDFNVNTLKRTDEKIEPSKKTEWSYPHSIKITNSISLVNISNLKLQCAVCWGKINYAKETLLFECCSGYCHLEHGIDWINNNHKCPRCGVQEPNIIELPSLTIN